MFGMFDRIYLLLAILSVAAAAPISKCFGTTTEIFEAQMADPPQTDIVLCPNTTISIGYPEGWPNASDFTKYVGGDIPLIILHDDVTVSCGDDRSSSNDCVLSGGVIQLLASAGNPLDDTGSPITTNNLVIQGLTFRQELKSSRDLEASDSPVTSGIAAVSFSAPGENMVLEDCIFEEIWGMVDIIYHGRNTWTKAEDMPPKSSSLTIRNTAFRDISYMDNVIQSSEQTTYLEDLVFERLLNAGTGNSLVIRVDSGSSTNLADSSFEDVYINEYLVVVSGTDTEFTYTDVTLTGIVAMANADDTADNSAPCDKLFISLTDGADESILNGLSDNCTSNSKDDPGTITGADSDIGSSNSSSIDAPAPTPKPTNEPILIPADDQMPTSPPKEVKKSSSISRVNILFNTFWVCSFGLLAVL